MLSSLLINILGIGGILERDADRKLEELRDKHPEASEWISKFQDWVYPQLANILDPATAGGLVKKIGAELASGHPSYDPGHWVIP